MPALFDTGIFSIGDNGTGVGAGWKLNFYTTGTSTRLDTYPTSADATAGTNANANPVVADAYGRLPAVWLLDQTYKAVLTDAAGVVKVTRDPVNSPLGASGGSASIGFLQSGTGAVARTVQDKAREWISAKDFGAVSDGATDCRTALANADTVGPVLLTPGLYKIASNLTLANQVSFADGARLVIPTGVTVTFSGGISGPDKQIFNITGTGAVAGLSKVAVAWFAGDLRGTSTDAVSAIQKAMDACSTGATVEWVGAYASAGGSYITVSKAQNVVSNGRTGASLLWTTAACLGLNLTTTEGARVSGINFTPYSIATIPTSGSAVKVQVVNCIVERCYSTHCYIGIEWASVNGGKDIFNNFNGAAYSANYSNNSPNIEITNASGSAYSDWLDCSTTANFIAGESLTFSSGGTGSWGYTCSATRAKIVIDDRTPTVASTITGATSGATCTVTSVTKGHQGGGLRMAANAAGCTITGGAWSGGTYAGVSTCAVDAHGTRPEYGTFSGCFFDHSDTAGFFLEYGAGMKFAACWFSSRAGQGLQINSAYQPVVTGCNLSHSWENGLLVGAAVSGLVCTGNQIEGNNRANSGKAGVYVIANCSDFVIQGNRIGGNSASGFGGTQARPVIVEVGTSDRYVIKNNLINGNTSGVSDGGTGVNKAVGENY